MTARQNSKINMNALSALIDFAAFYIIYILFDWNWFIALILSEIIGWSIRSAWNKSIANNEIEPKLISIMDTWWWVLVLVSIAPVILVLLTVPNRITPFGYAYGELFICGAIAYAGWYELTQGKKLRAAILFLSCLGWILLAIDMIMYGGGANDAIERLRTLEISTSSVLFSTLGLIGVAFLWMFIDTLRKTRKEL